MQRERDMKLVNQGGRVTMFVLASVLALSMAEASEPLGETAQGSLCHENLSHLQDEMEILLKSVYVNEFRETLRRSLKASIPEAVGRIDGLNDEIESLRKEIQHQIRVEKSAEFILRDITKTSDGPFKSCSRAEEGGYCETLERYYMAKAANLANRGFLQALECFQEKGWK
jgi:hypothetical protein